MSVMSRKFAVKQERMEVYTANLRYKIRLKSIREAYVKLRCAGYHTVIYGRSASQSGRAND